MKGEKTKINRIDFIVEQNPQGVIPLLQAAGFQIPGTMQGLKEVTKKWVRRDGDLAIVKLLQEHPEKDAILAAIKQSGYDQYGGCGCSSFDGECGCKSNFSGKARGGKAFAPKIRPVVRQTPVAEEAVEDRRFKEELEEEEQPIRKRKKRRNRESEARNKKASSRGLFTVEAKDLAIGGFFLGILLIASQVKS